MNSSNTATSISFATARWPKVALTQRHRRQVRLGEHLGIAQLTQDVGLGQAVRGPLGDVAAQFHGDLLPARGGPGQEVEHAIDVGLGSHHRSPLLSQQPGHGPGK